MFNLSTNSEKQLLHAALIGIIAIVAFAFSNFASAEDDAIDLNAEGGELMEPCDEGVDRPECTGVQARGTLVGPVPFKLKSGRYNTCLGPESTSKGARVRLYSCSNYSSRYWHVIGGQRGSGIKGEWNADWEYQLKNNWSNLCLTVRATSTTGNQVLIQDDCSNAGRVNFAPSSNPFAGEYVVIRGASGGPPGSADQQYCINAASSSSPVVNSSSNTTYQCAYWSTLLWHRAAF